MKKKLILLSLIFISLFGCTNTNSSQSNNISNNNSNSSSLISSILSTTSIEDNKTIITFNTEDKEELESTLDSLIDSFAWQY